MPTEGTQVYWHDLPEKLPPWRDAAELRACIQESKQVATSILQPPWDDAGQRPRKRPHLLTEHKKVLMEAKRQRTAVVRQLENPRIYRGVVPEPNATPLRVVNLIMTHLGQPAVSYDEANAAVEKVMTYYNTLTQPSQSQAALNDRGSSPSTSSPGRHRRSKSRRKDPVALATTSVLSQTQSTNVFGGAPPARSTALSASSQTANHGRRGTGLATELQNSLLLDVVDELGGARALRFKRLSRTDLGDMKWQVTSVEVVPHRRVVLLADRRDPYFVVLFGVPRGVKPEPFVVRALREDGRTPDSLRRYRRTEMPYTQVFCVAPAPVPWRRVWKNISVSAFRNEFAAAVVEVEATEEKEEERAHADDGGRGASTDAERSTERKGGRTSFANGVAAHASLISHSRVSPRQRAQRAVDLLGAGEEDDEDDTADQEWLLRPAPGQSAPSPSAERQSSVSDVTAQKAAMESRWINEAPMFEEDDVSAVHNPCSYDGLGNGDVAAAGQLDPLQRLPRTDARDRLANAKLRVWYRRLLTRPLAAELMERLREVHCDD